MESTSDDPGYYRERAAAARTRAEEAAEFPGESEAWVQVAEKWERLAERVEGKPAATAAEAEPIAPISGRDDETDAAGLTDHHLDAGAPPSEEVGSAPARRRVRRAPVMAACLLLPLLAVAAFWPTGKRATTVADNAAATSAQSEPQSSPSQASGEPAAEPPLAEATVTLAARASALDFAAQPPPAPERITDTPEPAVPTVDFTALAAPASERVAQEPGPAPLEIAMSETGSVGERSEPEPDAPLLEPTRVVSARQEPATVLDPQRLSPRALNTGRNTVAPRGRMTVSPHAKQAQHKSARRVAAPKQRAAPRVGTCTLLERTQAGPTWTVVARCSDVKASRPARIRLVLLRKRDQRVAAARLTGGRPSAAKSKATRRGHAGQH